ncbi:hypothetical protein SAMN02745217_03685 [Anaerocolumna xylanovorans DSM 12503]|uniref:Uncharacterized protein n=1 Tax=Anaerocolumna xylanovorans DSM 12503 TaxID=1121345 RepID=A0A1M7YIW0_9FIRM|nr:hypothetical protein SAMN02745217_03685 [Anaerocolumna xylanovorans DSM 12503]
MSEIFFINSSTIIHADKNMTEPGHGLPQGSFSESRQVSGCSL